MIKRTISLVLCFALLASTAFAGPVAYNLSERTRKNSAVRSLVLPGWGQQFNNQQLKGWVVSGGVILTLAGSYLLYTKANNTYDDYEKLGIKSGALYDDYTTQSNQAMYVSLLCAGIWIYGVVDAYIFGGEKAKRAENTPTIKVVSNRDQVGLIFSKRF